jgi:hypothetical protein
VSAKYKTYLYHECRYDERLKSKMRYLHVSLHFNTGPKRCSPHSTPRSCSASERGHRYRVSDTEYLGYRVFLLLIIRGKARFTDRWVSVYKGTRPGHTKETKRPEYTWTWGVWVWECVCVYAVKVYGCLLLIDKTRAKVKTYRVG